MVLGDRFQFVGWLTSATTGRMWSKPTALYQLYPVCVTSFRFELRRDIQRRGRLYDPENGGVRCRARVREIRGAGRLAGCAGHLQNGVHESGLVGVDEALLGCLRVTEVE